MRSRWYGTSRWIHIGGELTARIIHAGLLLSSRPRNQKQYLFFWGIGPVIHLVYLFWPYELSTILLSKDVNPSHYFFCMMVRASYLHKQVSLVNLVLSSKSCLHWHFRLKTCEAFYSPPLTKCTWLGMKREKKRKKKRIMNLDICAKHGGKQIFRWACKSYQTNARVLSSLVFIHLIVA